VLRELLGQGNAPRDATLAHIVAGVPAPRLPSHPLVSTDALERIRHACGQSFADLISLRSGTIAAFPDGVAYPMSAPDVRTLLRYAKDVGAHLIPYGGGTSVVGHINPQPTDVPVLTVDLSRLNRLHHLDTNSRLATFGAGVAGPDLEAHLRAHGYTLGHFPQSFERSTLGGWVATRSSGQQSLGYGRIEQLFAGGNLEAPAGTLRLPPFPASAAGPDLRELVLGSEGRLGILTEVTVHVTPLPKDEAFHAVFFPDWDRACAGVRAIRWHGGAVSLLRLSTPAETAMNFALAGHRGAVTLLEQYLKFRRVHHNTCMLLIGFTGDPAAVEVSRRMMLSIARSYGGVHVGRALGRQWQKSRFRAPYLRDELWKHGYAVDTIETATTWSNVTPLITAIETALHGGLADHGEPVHAFTHLSHVYPSGSSIYTTFLFRLGADAAETYRRWQTLKTIAMDVIIAHGGTISHQHGVGRDHQPYLAAEKGPLGMAALHQVTTTFDPAGLLNPGKLV
jgi:alkyldihydroxyacetonephosphate synthase